VANDTPSYELKPAIKNKLRTQLLADPAFDQRGRIDLILGADVALEILSGQNSFRPKKDEPITIATCLGILVGGNITQPGTLRQTRVHIATIPDKTAEQLQRFWEVEGLQPEKGLSLAEEKCEKLFASTTERAADGKLIVQVPFKEEKPCLGDSYDIARRRLAGTEARLCKRPGLRDQYEAFMDDYLESGHMLPVTSAKAGTVYLPHHPVIREAVLTTKLRVVFDASAKTSNGNSLNSEQLIGTVIQDDLFAILTRFRLHRVAINGDIAKMYRQIWLAEEHKPYHHILWRPRAEGPIVDFELQTVTYGTASAPWLATRSLKWIADQVQDRNPVAANIIRQDFYMDDLLSGADHPKGAAALQAEVSGLLLEYGLPLRKWTSNDNYVINEVKGDLDQEFLVNPEATVKTLGMQWHPGRDLFSYRVQLDKACVTKRQLISEIAKIFDPLGLLAPIIVTAKIMYQEVWKSGTEWDEPLPNSVAKQYEQFRNELPLIESITIPRWVGALSSEPFELHAFSDASEKAFGACVYIRTTKMSYLLASKTRVAPLKQVSLPRLELLGAVVAAQLINQVEKALRRPAESKFCWTDSTITLAWIKSEPHRFKVFVANRIALIQELTNKMDWRHVKGTENPADLASRGLMPNQLEQQGIWFNGPPWLQSGSLPEEVCLSEPSEELRKVQVMHAEVKLNVFLELIERVSSYPKLLRITSLVLRYTDHCRGRTLPSAILQSRGAFMALARVLQGTTWPKEYRWLKEWSENKSSAVEEKVAKVMQKSTIASLNPIWDSEANIMRVGGRIGKSKLSLGAKHPVLLPPGHLAKIYLEHLHKASLHAGPTLLLATSRQTVWIVKGKQLASSVYKKCITCTTWSAQVAQQQMGELPKGRVEGLRAFNNVGVDYCGPFTIKTRRGRGAPSAKAWLSVFVCFATKATHIEVVTELSTDAFMAAFRRFIGRRSRPTEMHSDNGTNFVGAEKELKLLLAQEEFQQGMIKGALAEGITWKFIPPAAPHQGGLWEAAVKSLKYHLKRVVGENALTYEELNTVVIQVEAQLNSRPLGPMSDDLDSLEILTPGHFLVGQEINRAPDPSLLHLKENRLSRWQLLQKFQQEFWQKWHQEYLTSLQKRQKWLQRQTNIRVGQLVLLKEENATPLNWKRGIVTQVHPGADGQVRVVTVKTSDGELKRPVVKVVVLDVEGIPSTGGRMLAASIKGPCKEDESNENSNGNVNNANNNN